MRENSRAMHIAIAACGGQQHLPLQFHTVAASMP
jgi:hypothetical protein